MKKLLSFFLALMITLGLAMPASAANPRASVMRLELVEGSVTVRNASGVTVDYSESMQLYSGYSVDTGDDSYAYISLDESKAIKLDMNTSVVIKKSWRKLKVELKTGQLIFNVTTPLAGNESLEIRTSTMITGVRGSSGGVNANTGEIFYGTGHGIVWLRETDQGSPWYGLSECKEIRGGQIVSVRWLVSDMQFSDFPALYLAEVAANPGLQDALEKEGNYDPQELIEQLPAAQEKEAAQREAAKEAATPLPDSSSDTGKNESTTVIPAFEKNDTSASEPVPDHPVIPDNPVIPDDPDTPIMLTITWKIGDETVTQEVEKGDMPSYSGAVPTKEADAQYSYAFSGWTPKIVEAEVDATYTATFKETLRSYTITWLDDEGNEIDTTSVAYGTVPTHATAQKEDTNQFTYTFVAWDPTPIAVTGEASYSAVFDQAPREYTI
ncbi:MAG: FecR domain-containing protein, partial [Oscillospiraceae bacterium]|nr:FecR domain-containing protein [Oscillospiraceae bacterium]